MLPLFLFGFSVSLSSLYCFSKLHEFKVPFPGSDTAFYWYIGSVLKEHGIMTFHIKQYFFSPLYAFCFYVFSLLGNSVSLACFFSSFCFLVSGIALFFLVKEIFNSRVAAISTLLFYIYKPLVFYSFLPLKTMPFILLTLVFLLFTLRGFNKEKNIYFFLAGLVSSFSLSLEGLFLPVFITVLCFFIFKGKSYFKRLGFLFIGFFLGFLPFGLRSYYVSKSFQVAPSLLGIHFYIGNTLGSDGVYKKVKDIRPNAFGHFYDAKAIAEKETGKKLTPSQVNLFWLKKSFSIITEKPTRFVSLFLRKILLTVNDFEVPNNFNFYIISKKIPTIRYNIFSFSVLFSFSMAGIVLYILIERKINLFLLLTLVYSLSLSLFFIASRYRLLLAVFLLPFAGFFVVELLRFQNRKILFVSFITGIFAFMLSKIPIFSEQARMTINISYERRLRYAEILDRIDKQYKYASMERKRKLLLKKAGLFYRFKMEEIAEYLRRNAKNLEGKGEK
ncbi:Dolichyl-phosphate-mannose-protein mannosyltransferase [Desulfurobacterium atlanticum]|uniref:Dolichyl-phosphate-mannose-protein mannosyltransferase n=2 Tax=Desulfurobacterium atlanticum TaxID=240169 RepID=A0A238ZCI7_9BACT|nr:Dolichyl-phosphate-mannose-protein mannosyltransferase [Desulfurobacterium atlanticum]